MSIINTGLEMEVNEEIFKAIFLNDLNRLQKIFVDYSIGSWNMLDKRGMAPVHYASFKGNLDIVCWLLDKGADVNFGKHKYSNSALHFGALNGSTAVCQRLLEAGAKRHVTNSIDRTPAQIAIDTGNFDCAILINNYLPKEEVMCFTKPGYTENESKLSTALAKLVYKFIMMTNIHPVKVVFEIPPEFLSDDNTLTIFNVLHLLSRREFEKHHDTKEMLCFKFHYLATILFEISNLKDITSKKPTDPKEVFLQKVSSSHNFLEQFLNNVIVKFNFKDSTIFRTMVDYMTRGMDSKLPLEIILLLVGNKRSQYGEPANSQPITCGACGEPNASKKCRKCKTVKYCNRKCRSIHTSMHKKQCKKIRKEILASRSSEETSALGRCFSKLGFK